jgi:L-2-hydroxyglutarate oxidase LhgO
MRYDVLIIGAGIIGLTTAHRLNKKNKNLKIAIIEKESEVALHASGRNSGVLHAGFYYTADSLKAKFTVQGNKALREYCAQHNIPVLQNGKLVITKDESELETLYELERRGKTNGVDITRITAKEAYEIEPHARTYESALFSPSTATVDPKLVSKQLFADLQECGVDFFFNTPYIQRISENGILAGNKKFFADKYINTAGLYADKIARDFGASQNYTIVPFKGVYLESTDPAIKLKTNLYPVPNLKNPFLGVHFTVTPYGKVKIGPTAMPAFWRENYDGIKRFSATEFYEVISTQLRLFKENSFNFRGLAMEELKKFNIHYLQKLASVLVQDLDLTLFKKWGNPGIRAQLLDLRDQSLVQDFVVEKGDNGSVHILNAVSPAFTCSFSFSQWVVENYCNDIVSSPLDSPIKVSSRVQV